ncbi:hypothetical protein [Alloprevotella rava]|uniref:hypothetical protein n=1 Tax=Alloprevotella rava TaxID=671218 RepID=UPI0012FCAC7C|nr:hypothetical protein [Alloprevotella rava]
MNTCMNIYIGSLIHGYRHFSHSCLTSQLRSSLHRVLLGLFRRQWTFIFSDR